MNKVVTWQNLGRAAAFLVFAILSNTSPIQASPYNPLVKPIALTHAVNLAVVTSPSYFKSAELSASRSVTESQIDQYKGLLPPQMYTNPDAPEMYRSESEIRARDEYEREHGFHLAKILKGSPDDKTIALTFDDGPHAKYTLELLSLLKSLDVKATFFVVGKQVAKFPTLVQLEVLEGNEIGNHTFDHVNLTQIPPDQIPYELDECDEILRHTIGSSARFFRPPGGDYNPAVIQAAAERGYITTLWSEDPGDFKHLPSGEILQRCISHIKPGAIFLLHDGIPETMEMLPDFVAEARRQGYTFVTMSQLAAEPGAIQ